MDVLNYAQQMLELAKEGKLQGIWFWASFYMLAVCLYSTFFQIQTRYWVSTRGTLHKLGVETFGSSNELSEQEYFGKALYSYNVEGQAFQGTRISPWIFVTNHNARGLLIKQQTKINKTAQNGVTVYYNPKRPKKSFLLKANKVGIVATIIAAIAPFMSYIVRFYL